MVIMRNIRMAAFEKVEPSYFLPAIRACMVRLRRHLKQICRIFYRHGLVSPHGLIDCCKVQRDSKGMHSVSEIAAINRGVILEIRRIRSVVYCRNVNMYSLDKACSGQWN